MNRLTLYRSTLMTYSKTINLLFPYDTINVSFEYMVDEEGNIIPSDVELFDMDNFIEVEDSYMSDRLVKQILEDDGPYLRAAYKAFRDDYREERAARRTSFEPHPTYN